MPINALKENLRFTMRAIRGIMPTAEDYFELNQTSLMSAGFDPIFKITLLVTGLLPAITHSHIDPVKTNCHHFFKKTGTDS